MKKLKRMLAFMLKDELIELVQNKVSIKSLEYVERTIEFNTIKLEHRIPSHIYENPSEYERALRVARHELAQEALKSIEIDSFALISPENMGDRVIRLILRVQTPRMN